MTHQTAINVLGQPLAFFAEGTGFYRDGYCNTGRDDSGSHVIAAYVTREFLDFTRAQGNDLETPRPQHAFPGLKPGDAWCLCALRWLQAQEAGIAPPVNLAATHAKALQFVPLDLLMRHSPEDFA